MLPQYTISLSLIALIPTHLLHLDCVYVCVCVLLLTLVVRLKLPFAFANYNYSVLLSFYLFYFFFIVTSKEGFVLFFIIIVVVVIVGIVLVVIVIHCGSSIWQKYWFECVLSMNSSLAQQHQNLKNFFSALSLPLSLSLLVWKRLEIKEKTHRKLFNYLGYNIRKRV